MLRYPFIIAALLLLALAALLAAGEYLSTAAHRAVGPAPPGLHAETVSIPAAGGQLAGWMLRAAPHTGAILLLHGVRADRREMLERARFLSKLGYSVLLVDLPAHGESSGSHITFGARESAGVTAALAYLAQQLPNERIGVIGVSLGAAALALARPGPAIAAAVLESMFPTIEEAVANRLDARLVRPAGMLAPLLVQQMPLRFGISPAQLRPIDAMAALRCPVFLFGGALDLYTPVAESRRIFAAIPQPKQLWIVDGAGHVDLHSFARVAYEAKIAQFFAAHLR